MALFFSQSLVEFIYTIWQMEGIFFVFSGYFRAMDKKQGE
jgi:hypothetical protein